jgi:hypothetical protein
MKTNELIGPALDWAVAKCLPNATDVTFKNGVVRRQPVQYMFSPSTDWAQGGPIIDSMGRCGLRITGSKCRYASDKPTFSASLNSHYKSYGLTPLIAAMRCYVASKLGDEVDLPEELLK